MNSANVVPLGEAATFIRGITFKPDDVVPLGTDGTIACMRTKNVQAELDATDVWGVPGSLTKRKDQYLRRGDVLVSSANSWNLVGKCCWVPELPWPATFGGFISVLRADSSRVEPRYLYHWFASSRVQAKVRSFGRQTTNISNLSIERCRRLPFPLPPLPEQRRIAAILDQADALRAKRRAAIAKLDQLTQSIFLDMFGDPATNPKGWPDGMCLGDVAEIVSGITKGRKLNGQTTYSVPYLAVANVQHRALDLSTVKSIDATETEIDRYRLVKDDLLLTEGGDPDKLGRGTLWGAELPVCIHQNHIFRVRLTTTSLLPTFLSWLVSGERARKYFLRSAKQTTGIASINMTQLRGLPLLIPPVNLQREFARRTARVELLRIKLCAAQRHADALFASLQQRAFRGELYP